MNSGAPDDSGVVAIGQVVAGRYKIERMLGSGGMGRVYRGQHTAIGKPVAIKVLHAALGHNQEAATRFQREAVASGRLDHPNIVSVLDFGELDNGNLYLVMEALEGEHLGHRLAREKVLLWSDAVMIARGVLLGLRHAHERGIVHRDIKPDNIFLANKDGEEVVKILDFGIAKFYASGAPDDQTATRAGIAVGTPTYLSPEQAVGDPITPACDLYSTSVVLYEMLVGRAPFEDDDVIRLMTAHASADVPAFRELVPDIAVPDGLEEIVRDGLAKRAANRIGSALEYVQRLDEILLGNDVEIAAMPLSARGSEPISIPVGPYTSSTPAPGRFGRASTSVPRMSSPRPEQIEPRRAHAWKWLALAAVIVAGGMLGAHELLASGRLHALDAPPQVDDRASRLEAALHGLQQGATCAERKATIPTLVELGDASAIAALKKAWSRGPANACLRAAADDAIKKLGAAAKKP